MKIIELYERLNRVPAVVDEIVKSVNSIAEYIRYKSELKKEERHFVVIFIQAVKIIDAPTDEYSDYGHPRKIISNIPVTMCLTGYAPHCFNFQPDIPIAKLQIAVICDISKVRIETMVVANQHLCPSIVAAPLAYFEGKCEPSNRITIDTRLW